MDYKNSKLPPFLLLDEPQLTFNPDDSFLDVNPLRGLNKFGAYNKESFQKYTTAVRIATIIPENGGSKIKELVNTLRTPHYPNDRKEYVSEFNGFEKLFGIPLVASQTKLAHIKWPNDLNNFLYNGNPSVKLMQAIKNSIEQLMNIRDQFDVVLIYLPKIWEFALKTPSFDAHDYIKAISAQSGIPTQVINDRAFTFNYKASLAWRLSIALYVKAGGIPWKLAPLPGIPENTAYIGLAYALKDNLQGTHYVTCCSQVFDADGGGMQFVAFEARDHVENIEDARRNPFLSRNDMRSVLARSLNLYQTRNVGMLPRRLVIHKTTPFKTDELDGAFDALSAIKEVECIQVTSNPGLRGVWLKKSQESGKISEPDGYPVPRGTVLQRTEKSALIWVAGNAPSASLKNDYYQGKKSIPCPINITRFTGDSPMQFSALEALALTKMDWNNDALYDPVPVTIRYSQQLAKIIANVPDLPSNAYAYRLFM